LFPVLLRLGPLTLHSYPTLVNLGLIVGAVLFATRAWRRGLPGRISVDMLLGTGLGALLLGRAGYVAVHWDYYVEHQHLAEALRLWRGGLLWQAALLGAIAGAAVVCVVRRVSFLRMLDFLAPCGAVVALFAWLACFTAGCAWGVETYPGQGLLWSLTMDLPDLYGVRRPRVAAQPIGAVWSAFTLGTVLLFRNLPRKDGLLFGTWLLLQSLGHLGLSFLRADPTLFLAGWRVDQLAHAVLALAGGLLLGIRSAALRRQRQPQLR